MATPMMRRRILINRRRRNRRQSSWPVRLLSEVWQVGPSFLSTVILWSVTFYKSSQAEQLAYNSSCSYPNPSPNNNCLHIKIPIPTNLFLFTLSFYTVCKTAIVTVRLVEYEGAIIKKCKDRYKWAAVLTISVLALIVPEPFDGAATPWVRWCLWGLFVCRVLRSKEEPVGCYSCGRYIGMVNGRLKKPDDR